MTVRRCQWCCVNAPVTDMFVQKNVIESDIFQFFFLKNLELLLGPDASGKNTTPTDVSQFFLRKKLKSKKKDVIVSDVFATRHWHCS
jgi:hypothetical protein